GFLVLAGQVKGNAIFGGGQSHGNNFINAFVATMNPSGGWLQVNRIVSNHWVDIKGLALDPSGYIYVSGGFGGSWTYGSINLTADIMGDCFLAKFDNLSTDCLWVKQAGNNADDWGGPVAVKASGEVYWAGYFIYQLQLGDFTIPYNSSGDIFLARLSPEGDYQWAGHVGGICEDYPYAMVLDPQERICLAGAYTGEMYFDDIHLPWSQSDEIFVARRYDLPVAVNDQDSPDIAGISNYPNPFSASTTIVYELKAPASNPGLEIYNLRGQMIRQFRNIPATAGNHRVDWDRKDKNGNRVAPGLYYYRLQSGANQQIGKMLILN
ncbi:MAG TPA: T9SS type A sorting domain-containing protein, partial [Candidatus Cloacimonadota bacterium]|nr:T9SS type A sorting domain-containing protein [Candidatus Cloacimonadota bacterium]